MIELIELDRPTGSATNVLVFPMSPETANPEAVAARAQLRGLLEQAVDELPASFRLVFMMRDIEEVSLRRPRLTSGSSPRRSGHDCFGHGACCARPCMP